jgi:hypothetical protein
VQVDDLDLPEAAAQHPLGPRRVRRRRQPLQRLARGDEHAEQPPTVRGRRVVERRLARREAGVGQRGAPQRQRPRRHLLQGDHVGADAGDRLRLLGLPRDAPGDVPGHEPH